MKPALEISRKQKERVLSLKYQTRGGRRSSAKENRNMRMMRKVLYIYFVPEKSFSEIGFNEKGPKFRSLTYCFCYCTIHTRNVAYCTIYYGSDTTL